MVQYAGGSNTAYRKSRAFPLLIAAAALGTVLSAAPAEASVASSHVTGTAYHCYWRTVSGHWVWPAGERARLTAADIRWPPSWG